MKKNITKWLPDRWRRMSKMLSGTALMTSLTLAASAQFPAPYCNFTLTNTLEPITLVNFAGINQTSSGTVVSGATATNQGLTNYTSVTGTVAQSLSFTATLKGNTNGSYTTYFTIFIDWNQNNNFADAGETYQVGSITNSTGADTIQATGTVTVPATALLGTTRMRVVKQFNIAATSACSASYGAAQDYTINVTTAPCAVPSATYTVVPDCANNQFYVNVNISSMGDAAGINIREGTTIFATASAPGTFTAGPFANNTSHTLTLQHSGNPLCNVTSPAQTYSCPPANNECINATAFPSIPTDGTCVSLTANTAFATQSSAGCVGNADDDVWYSFVCPPGVTTLSFTNTTLSGNTDRVVQFFSGTCGNLTSLLCSDPESGVIAGLVPGETYYMRIYTYSAGTAASVSVCLQVPPQMAYVSSTTTQSSSSALTAGSTNQQIIRTSVVVSGAANPLNVTQLDYNTAGSTNAADILNARVYFTGASTTFATTTPFGSTVANPNGAFSITGSQPLAGGTSNTTNYFWLVYDVACNATAANVLDAQCTSVTVGTPRIPTTTNPSGTRAISALTATSQPSTGTVIPGSLNNQILRVDVNPCGSSGTVESLTFATTGSTNAATDIASAKAYYTTSTTFGTTTQFGTAVANPNGTFTITGSQPITATGYFWLVYDLNCNATSADVIDAAVTSVTISGANYTPPTANPTGTRTIAPLIATNQPSTGTAIAGTLNNQVLRVDVNPCGASGTVGELTFTTNGSTNPANDILAAKVYYTTTSTFSSANQYGTTVAGPNGTFTVTGAQPITATGYFWLVYDLNCSAAANDVIDAALSYVTVSGTSYTSPTPNPTGTRTINAATFTGTTIQPATTPVTVGSVTNPVLRIDLTGCVNSSVTSATFSTTGTTNVADIAAATVYFTPTATFNTAMPFGTPVAGPNGSFTVNGSQLLASGSGYLWLTYDVAAVATPVTDSVDAACVSVSINGNTITPATANPAGKRQIIASSVTNDNASGAIALTVGAGCTGAPYSTVSGSLSPGEPYPSCSGAAVGPVWFSFVAPVSGAVRVTTDVGSGFTFSDSKIAVFSATDVNDYGTFNIIVCDDDGGSSSIYMSIVYATGLTPGRTYYVAVDRFALSTAAGTFCIAVDELNSSMLSATNTCSSSYQTPAGSIATYNGWVPLLDGAGKLVALVRNPAGSSVSSFSFSQNVNTGALREDANGLKYLDRNFRIVSTATNCEVQLFMLTTEQAALQSADPAATLAGLNITRQTGESGCSTNFSSGGTNSLITQTASGAANGVSWIRFTTPGFSNFFVNSGTTPLPVDLEFSGYNSGADNNLIWHTSREENFSHFVLERSADGKSFSNLAIIESKGAGSNYNHTDRGAPEGKNLYRLHMVDKDGRSVYSNVVTLNVQPGLRLSLSVHPNPVTQQLHVDIKGAMDGRAQIHVLDIAGRCLQTIPVSGPAVSVDMSKLPPGTYMIRYTDQSHSDVQKVSKN